MIEWLMAQEAFWLSMIFPGLIAVAIIGAIVKDYRKWNAKVHSPYTMTNGERGQHNRERFSR